MNILFLSLLLLQGIPIQPTLGGTVTGVLRNSDGKPAPGVRVAAIPQTQFAADAGDAATLSSIAETDEQGRYSLENVPPGRYYIAAGRLDLQTYFPGTQAMNAAAPVRVEPGARVEGIDFALIATSAGRAVTAGAVAPGFLVPLNILVEGGGKLPVSGNGKLTIIKLSSATGVFSARLIERSLNLSPGAGDYRITFEGLPADYSVTSIKYGTTPLTNDTLRVTTTAPVNTANTPSVLALLALIPPQPQVLSIVLNRKSTAQTKTGATVRGTLPRNAMRVLYLSGAPGTVFADGSFEFMNVPPGRHVIVTADNPPSTPGLGASLVVGTTDVENVEIATIPVIPSNIRTLSVPQPSGSRGPGPIPLASLRGRVLDSETGKPVSAGTVYIVGDTWARFDLSGNGQFEFLKLLPGKYEVEVQGAGYPTFRHPVVIEEQDVDLELKAG
jgi:hypothetical protein